MGAPRQTPTAAARVDSRLHLVILICFVAIMSYLAARLSTTVVVRPQVDWPLWPGNILLVCVLLFVRRKIWPVLMAAALLTFGVYDLQIGLPMRSVIFFQLTDAAEMLTAALGLSYAFGGVPQLNGVKALAKFLLFGVILPPMAGATFGGLTTQGEYWTSWRIDFLSGALEYLTLMPAILGWVGKRSEWLHASLSRYLEALALATGLAVFAYLSFVSPSTFILAVLTVVPFLLWAALRFGTTGVSSAMIGVAFLALWGAVHGRGPWLDFRLWRTEI